MQLFFDFPATPDFSFKSFVACHGNNTALEFVKKVMEFYGGSIQVDSALGKGSEFIAWFPEKSIG